MSDIEAGFVDISEEQDGGLLKKILVEGKGEAGETPPVGSHVSVHYVGTLHEDGSKFDSSRDRPGTFKFDVGVGQVIKGWDVGICTMKKGEKAILRASSDFAYGDDGSPPKIPGKATLNFEVELFSWKEKVKEPYEMTVEERRAHAQKHKDLGNAAFGKQEFDSAIESYEEGVKYISHTEDDYGGGGHGGGHGGGGHDHGHSHGGAPCSGHGGDDDEDAAMGEEAPKGLSDDDQKLAVALLSNCAMARLKVNDAEPAISDCTKALAIDKANVKAMFRRAQAHQALGNWEDAVSDAKGVLELDKENKQAEQLIAKVAHDEKTAKKKEKAMYSKMFG